MSENPGPDLDRDTEGRPIMSPVAVISGRQFGIVLRGARLASGIKPADLAAALDVAPSTVYARETARRPVNVDEAVATLDACGYRLIVAPLGWAVGEVRH